MKLLFTITIVLSTFSPLLAESHKKYKKEDFEVIKLMNDGGSIEEIDIAIEEWALVIQKGQLLNSMVDRKDETQTTQEQSAGIAQPTN